MIYVKVEAYVPSHTNRWRRQGLGERRLNEEAQVELDVGWRDRYKQAPDGRVMRLARIFLACVVALSVAMLPIRSVTAVSAKSAEMAVPTDMSAAMEDCCPDHTKPCDQGGDRCQSMACCAHQSFSISNVAVLQFTYPLEAGRPFPALAEQAAPLHAGNPPFRPPRV